MRKKKKAVAKKTPSKPTVLRTDELCRDLVALAAFGLANNPHAQEKVYAAVRRLQELDKAAVEAGILPST